MTPNSVADIQRMRDWLHGQGDHQELTIWVLGIPAEDIECVVRRLGSIGILRDAYETSADRQVSISELVRCLVNGSSGHEFSAYWDTSALRALTMWCDGERPAVYDMELTMLKSESYWVAGQASQQMILSTLCDVGIAMRSCSARVSVLFGELDPRNEQVRKLEITHIALA